MTELWPVSIAQTDPLSGGAGWAGAGLLGLVLLWIFIKLLPDLAKERKDLASSHQAAMSAQREDFLSALSDGREEFKVALDRILHQHEVQGAHLVAAIDKDAQLTRQLITESRRREEDTRRRDQEGQR